MFQACRFCLVGSVFEHALHAQCFTLFDMFEARILLHGLFYFLALVLSLFAQALHAQCFTLFYPCMM